VAVLVLSALVLLFIVWVASGGGRQLISGHPSSGFFGQIDTLAGNGPGSFAAADLAAENAAIDRTLAYTPYVSVAGAQHREIALTFDDGPGPYTPQVLRILERENVPATFFQVGSLQRYFHASTAEMLAHGYAIGDHTESHAPLSRLSVADQKTQILDQTAVGGQYGVTFPRLFRPPYGLWNSTTLELLRKYRMLMVLWTVDTSDYRQPGVQSIVDSVLSGARPGAIILMHDAGGTRTETIAALPTIIDGLRARGYQLVTVPKLVLDNPPPGSQQVQAGLGSGG
jgi:peptidoglycan/xylan/chitin deacetylase (PgdA/CDA1 family)